MKPQLLYIILGLIMVILVALGLGTRRREGFDSIANVNTVLLQIVDNMNGAINVLSWNSNTDKSTFITNVNYWFLQKMTYLVQQGGVDLKTYDKNNNQQIYKLNPAFQGKKDLSGNSMPLYVDDAMTVPPIPDFLQQYTIINIANTISKTQLNVLWTQIENRVNNFSSMDPQGQARLQIACDKLNKYSDELADFLIKNPTTTGTPSFINILSQGTMTPAPFSASPNDPTANIMANTNVANSGNTVASNSGNTVANNSGNTAASNVGNKVASNIGNTVVSNSGNTIANSGNTSANMNQTVRYDVKNNTNVINPYLNPPTASPWGNAGAGFATSGVANTGSPNTGFANTGAPNTGGGITQANIPPGSNDMYLLKTQVIPPSNPAGAAENPSPSSTQTCGCKPAPVAPCPPCERCPEPAFDCKKVPNYNSASINQYLPQPVLADFSQFGM